MHQFYKYFDNFPDSFSEKLISINACFLQRLFPKRGKVFHYPNSFNYLCKEYFVRKFKNCQRSTDNE